MAKTSTPWGAATVVEELRVPQRVGGKHFACVVELLENERGDELVRVAYSTNDMHRRGPVTLRVRDLERIRRDLGRKPALARVLGIDSTSDGNGGDA
jgi:hypothetical protein